MNSLFKMDSVYAGYGAGTVIRGVDLSVFPGDAGKK